MLCCRWGCDNLSMNVILRLLELMLSLCGGVVVGWFLVVVGFAKSTTVLRLCCVVLSLGL